MKDKSGRMQGVQGLELVGQGNADDIRRTSNVLCLLLVCYPLMTRILRLPLAYLAYLLGFHIRINPLTGLISQTPALRTALSAMTEVVSLSILILLIAGLYYRPIAGVRMFRRPQKGVAPVAIPMILGVGAAAMGCASLLGRMLRFVGLVVYVEPEPIRSLTPEVFTALVTGLVLAILQELLFRGALLAALRQFGDEFAVLISAVLFAVWCGGVAEAAYGLLFGICAAYFTIRSGSIYVALAGRAGILLMMDAFRLCRGMLPSRDAQLIVVAGLLLLAAAALLAYLRFLRLDPLAFQLKAPEDAMSTRTRVSAFCGSVCFVLFVLGLLYRTVGTIQVIG